MIVATLDSNLYQAIANSELFPQNRLDKFLKILGIVKREEAIIPEDSDSEEYEYDLNIRQFLILHTLATSKITNPLAITREGLFLRMQTLDPQCIKEKVFQELQDLHYCNLLRIDGEVVKLQYIVNEANIPLFQDLGITPPELLPSPLELDLSTSSLPALAFQPLSITPPAVQPLVQADSSSVSLQFGPNELETLLNTLIDSGGQNLGFGNDFTYPSNPLWGINTATPVLLPMPPHFRLTSLDLNNPSTQGPSTILANLNPSPEPVLEVNPPSQAQEPVTQSAPQATTRQKKRKTSQSEPSENKSEQKQSDFSSYAKILKVMKEVKGDIQALKGGMVDIQAQLGRIESYLQANPAQFRFGSQTPSFPAGYDLNLGLEGSDLSQGQNYQPPWFSPPNKFN